MSDLLKLEFNKEDPAFEDKLLNHIISMLIASETDINIVSYLQETYRFGLRKAEDKLRHAKRTIKFYKCSDIEICIKTHSQRYDRLAKYAHKLGIASSLLRIMRAHKDLLSMNGGRLALAVQGGVVKALDRTKIEGGKGGSFSHISLEDKLWLREVLIKMKK